MWTRIAIGRWRVAVDRVGRVLDSLEFVVDELGFEQLLARACSVGKPAYVVEGTGSDGASLARFMLARGH